MTELTPRERRRQARLDEIIDVAMAMIVAGGIEAFSVNKLAEELGYTPGALYRYYASRDAILAAVEVRVLEEFDAYFEAVDAALGVAAPLERIMAMALGYAALQNLRPERFELMSRFVSGGPVVSDDVAAEVVGPTLRVLGHLTIAVTDAMEAGALREDKALQRAALTWSCVQGLLDRRKLTRFSPELFDLDELLVDLLAALMRGWGAEPELVDAAIAGRPSADFFATILEELK